MNINWPSVARSGKFPGALLGRGLLLGTIFLWFIMAVSTTAEFDLQIRAGFTGDPYLITNSAGQISLVLNPDVLITNSDYQRKVTAFE